MARAITPSINLTGIGIHGVSGDRRITTETKVRKEKVAAKEEKARTRAKAAKAKAHSEERTEN